nr:MAG TPA: Integrase [Caudoviricetes sp.]
MSAVKRKDSKGRILREGEIQKKDGRYEYRFNDADGVRRSVYSWKLTETDFVPAGKRECKSLREMERTIQRDVSDNIVARSRLTLDDRWKMYIKGRSNLRESTIYTYTSLYNLYISPRFGTRSISSIKYSDVLAFFTELIDERHLAVNTFQQIRGILNQIFKVAVRDGYIRTNPCSGVSRGIVPKTIKTESKKALTETEQTEFINYLSIADRCYNGYKELFLCLLGTGCRVGEMLGLKWCDIDWNENVIYINRTMVYGPYGSDGAFILKVHSPKTPSGERVIPMLTSVRQILKDRYEEQTEKGLDKVCVDGQSGFVWVGEDGSIMTADTARKKLRRIIALHNSTEKQAARVEKRKAILLPQFSPHTLRHTFCTRLCERENDLKTIQEIMGHSDITITMNIYNNSNTERKKASFKSLDTGVFDFTTSAQPLP